MAKKQIPLEESEVVTLVGMVSEFLPQLYNIRKTRVVIEEIISQQVVQGPANNIQFATAQPKLEIMMSAVIIVEKQKQ